MSATACWELAVPSPPTSQAQQAHLCRRTSKPTVETAMLSKHLQGQLAPRVDMMVFPACQTSQQELLPPGGVL
eukprot:1354816-Lingulodinium_polyedra.AAC.1